MAAAAAQALPVDDRQSKVADIANISNKRQAGAILAAEFLREFTEDVPWAHVDIAATGMVGGGGTGFGVRLALAVAERLASDRRSDRLGHPDRPRRRGGGRDREGAMDVRRDLREDREAHGGRQTVAAARRAWWVIGIVLLLVLVLIVLPLLFADDSNGVAGAAADATHEPASYGAIAGSTGR